MDVTLSKQWTFFGTQLTGKQEVPPVNLPGSGFATFRVNPPQKVVIFELHVFDIPNVTQAHIHLGKRGENGPVVAFLFGFVPGGVTVNGLLSKGAIPKPKLLSPLAGKEISALVEEMRNGNTYVNVHTVAHPPGEIWGQIRQTSDFFGEFDEEDD